MPSIKDFQLKNFVCKIGKKKVNINLIYDKLIEYSH